MQEPTEISGRRWLVAAGPLLLCAVLAQPTPAYATKVLLSGNALGSSMTNLTATLVDMGLDATIVAPVNFDATDLAGYDAVWLDGFSQYGTGSWPTRLSTFMNAGGTVLVQNPGFGSEGLGTYPLGSGLTATFTYPPGQNTVAVVDSTGPLGARVNQGLNGSGLSGWNASAYGYFTNIDAFTGLTDTGTAGEWITIATTVGTGYLVYTQQGISQYLDSANPGAGSQAARFLNNVVTLGAAAVPEPPLVGLLLLGLVLIGLGARRGHGASISTVGA